jgi:hypothetical protein
MYPITPKLQKRSLKLKIHFFTVLGFLVLCTSPSYVSAQEQLTVGNACTTGQNASDWDQIMQCVSSVWARASLWLGTGTCDSSHAGLIQWSSPNFQVCNGAAWSSVLFPVTAPAYTSPPNNGYFVLTASTWNGNLSSGGYSGTVGADALCYTELTSTYTSWKGYSTANSNGQLVANKIHAFVAANDLGPTNANLVPNATYAFAYAADGTKGGATFTTDSSGLGPNDSNNWSGSTYFGASYSYWTGRLANTSTTWGGASAGTANLCTAFSVGTSSVNGIIGSSNNTNNFRWNSSSTTTCDNMEHIICAIDP